MNIFVIKQEKIVSFVTALAAVPSPAQFYFACLSLKRRLKIKCSTYVEQLC